MEPPVLCGAAAGVGDALGVADDEGADVMVDRPCDDGVGGFVLGLVDPSPVTRLGTPLLVAEFAPAAAAALPAPRRLRAHVAVAGFGVGEMDAFLGADRSARDQQRLIGAGDGVGVDDPEIDAGDPVRVDVGGHDRNRGGDIEYESAGVDHDFFDTIDAEADQTRGWDVPIPIWPARRSLVSGAAPL